MDPTEEWVESTEQPGYKVKYLKYGNCTIELYRPILEEKEIKRREAQIKTVAERVLFDYYKRKGELEHEQHNHN